MAAVGQVRLKPTDRIVGKWSQRAQAGLELYREFTANPRRDPTAAAISMKATIQAKMANAATWDKWESALRSVGFAGYLYGVQKKGVERFVPGITAGEVYFRQFMNAFLPHLSAGLPSVYAMPKATLDQAIARAAAMIRHNAGFKFRKTGVQPGATV